MRRTLIALIFSGILFAALPAFAQSTLTGTSALTISSQPAYPSPNSIVQLTVESPLLDLKDSSIQWVVNGKVAGTGQTIRVPVGSLGSGTSVNVSVSGPTGSDSASTTLIPTSIDLLWESSSYVPPFYKGRAAPGSGSSIRVLAIPHFVTSSGAGVPSSNIDFTWTLNGGTAEAQSGLGESSAVFPAATLYDTDVIDVVARTTDGSLSGEASVTIRTQDPELVLYQDSPLFGITYYSAVPSSSVANESETSFAAVPYFASASSANDASLAYQWTVSGSPVATDPQDPSEITVNARSAGVANIGLSIESSYDPFFSASGAWQVSFSGAAGAGNSVFESSSTTP